MTPHPITSIVTEIIQSLNAGKINMCADWTEAPDTVNAAILYELNKTYGEYYLAFADLKTNMMKPTIKIIDITPEGALGIINLVKTKFPDACNRKMCFIKDVDIISDTVH